MNTPTDADIREALQSRRYYLAGAIRTLRKVVSADAARVKTFIAALREQQAELKTLEAEWKDLQERIKQYS